jgi:phosphatidate cytidylyltransferase
MTTASGNAATAPSPGRADGSLPRRILSALVLAPLAIAAVWFGSPWLPLLAAGAAAVMAWEWRRLCGGGHFGWGGAVLAAVVLAVVALAGFGPSAAAVALAVLGGGLVFLAVRGRGEGDAGWTAFGALWIGLPAISLLWLARAEPMSRATLLWIFALVWATDIGAYAAGRIFGGPRLAPRWSPHKTWAGLAGGIAGAAAVGWASALLLGHFPVYPLVLLSAALAIVEQFGDLAESVAKRRFGVKDSSGLIPGHGGLFDRLDGLLAVLPAVALLTLIGGRSVLAWR